MVFVLKKDGEMPLNCFEGKNILINNFLKIVEYSLAIPEAYAAMVIIFSITNLLWTDEKIAFLFLY